MNVGLYLVNQAQAQDDHAELLRYFVDQAVLAEDCGYDGIYLGDHVGRAEYAFYEPLTVLTAIAERTERVELGQGILLAPLYHPVRLAQRTGTLDALSNGRLRMGFGPGGLPSEFEAFEVPRDERVPRTLETIDVLEKLWAEDHVRHDGTAYDLEDVTINPKPTREDVPIWLGFNGEWGLDYIARSGYGWLTLSQVAPETWERRVDTFHEALSRHDRTVEDTEMGVLVEASVAEDYESAVDLIRDPIETKFREYAGRESPPPLFEGVDPEDVTFERYEDLFAVGTPEDVAETLLEYREQGFDNVLVRFPGYQADKEGVLSSIELLGEAVIPRLEE
ncbi:LLM class flavin-dependent oxidoreductase [Natrarchaeobius sp. A-rgal3]|uniref:LLM class flavin-dependent oxidoreductase n=1 Tax=Natrarchaeobius versutus TaxID=1679078 RepID=UPI00350FDFA3